MVHPTEPTLAVCPRCGRKDDDCPSCGGRGTYVIDKNAVPSIAYRVAQLAEMYLDHGIPPVSGGSLEQSNWFVEAANFVVSDRERMIAERYGKA